MELRPITWDNFEECVNQSVREDQKHFVANNRFSLAQAYVAQVLDQYPLLPRAIYRDGAMVGFVMLGRLEKQEKCYPEESYYIYRFLIDQQYQGKGYGKEAFRAVLDFIKTFPQGPCGVVYLSYEPDNEVARKLYRSFGFEETGEIDNGEVVARLELGPVANGVTGHGG